MTQQLLRSGTPITSAELLDFEQQLGSTLPTSYRAFLEAHNGGVPKRNQFQFTLTTGKKRRGVVQVFFPLTSNGWIEPAYLPLTMAFTRGQGITPEGTLPIGVAETDQTSGVLHLGCTPENSGHVYYQPLDTKKKQHYLIANTIDELLQSMKANHPPEPWDELIEMGDVVGFRTWLLKHRRKWDHGSDRIDIERKAVIENQLAILEMLVAEFEFTEADIVEDCLDYHRIDLALKFTLKLREQKQQVSSGVLLRSGPYFWYSALLVELLISTGADVNEIGDDGLTPLHQAAAAGSQLAVDLLLKHQADPTANTDDELTPADRAAALGFEELSRHLQAAALDWMAKQPVSDNAVQPFDLCGVQFSKTGPTIDLSTILAVEKSLKLDFPPEYRWLLIQANGALLKQDLMPKAQFPGLYSTDEEDEVEEDDRDDDESDDEQNDEEEGFEIQLQLLPLTHSGGSTDNENREDDDDDNDDGSIFGRRLDYPVTEAIRWYHDGSEMPRGYVPIGSLENFGDGGFLLLGCKGKDRGRLFAFDHGKTPLKIDLPTLFQLLAKAGQRPKAPVDLLADAIDARDLEGIKAALAAGAGKVLATRNGRIPVRMAGDAKYAEALFLIGCHGDIGEAIHQALQHSLLPTVHQLLDHIPKIKIPKEVLNTCFCFPFLYWDLPLMEKLISRGANLSKVLNDPWQSCLMSAVQSGSVAGVTWLFQNGGNPQYRTREQKENLMHALCHRNQAEEAEMGDPRPMIQFLLSHKVPLDQRDEHQQTPLHTAIAWKNVELAKALIDFGARLDGPNQEEPPDPKNQKMMAAAQKQMEKLMAEMTSEIDDTVEDEEALDDTDPANAELQELQDMGKQMQQALKSLIPQMQAGLGQSPTGIPQHITRRPDCAALIEELRAYERTIQKPTS